MDIIRDDVRHLLRIRYANEYGARIEPYIDSLLSEVEHASRFRFISSIVGTDTLKSLERALLSGVSAGSEMLAAASCGFKRIDGVDIDSTLIEVAKLRTAHLAGCSCRLYDGDVLPFEDGAFGLIYSSHVIEHTSHPTLYLDQLLRCVKPGGLIYLEFPNRYHHTELHTGLPSLEWLPPNLRDRLLRLCSSRWSPLPAGAKSGYHAILRDLRQISPRWILQRLQRRGLPKMVLLVNDSPASGVARLLLLRTELFNK